MPGRMWNDPLEKTYEDFALGDTVITRGRTVDIGDISMFSGLTGDHYPLHTDEEYGKSTRFGTRHGRLPSNSIESDSIRTSGWASPT